MNNRNLQFSFRCFDKVEKEMYYFVEFLHNGKGTVPEMSAKIRSFGELLKNPRYIVMQCLGLKDSGGEFIYTGDLLNIEIKGKSKLYVVIYNNELANFDIVPANGKESKDLDNYTDIDNITCVGNIYENKSIVNIALN